MLRIVAFGLTLALFGMGCVDEVAAPRGVEEPFSIYGILNPRLVTQSMLVAPPSRFFEDYPEAIDAVVTTTNLETGEWITWKDSVVTGDRGQRDHVFVGRFRPEFGSRHSVLVTRSDGAVSTAEVKVPGRVSLELDDDGTRYFAGRVLGETFRLHRAEIVYGVRFYKVGMPPDTLCAQPLEHYSFPLTVSEMNEGDYWQLETNMHEDWDYARSYYFEDHGWRAEDLFFEGLALMDMGMEVTVGDESWNPPGGTFDQHVLSSPRALTNVENGFGFIGAGYNQDFSVWPSKESVKDAWFFDFLMRPPGDCLDFCSCGRN